MTSDLRLYDEEMAEILLLGLTDAIADLPLAMKRKDLGAFIDIGNKVIGLEKVVKRASNKYFFSNTRADSWIKLVYGVPEDPVKKSWIWFDKKWLNKNYKRATKVIERLNKALEKLLSSDDDASADLFKKTLSSEDMMVIYAAVKVADSFNMDWNFRTVRVWDSKSVFNLVEDYIFAYDEPKELKVL